MQLLDAHFLESTSQVEYQPCMQANMDVLHFVTVICFFSHSTTIIIVTILLFLILYAVHFFHEIDWSEGK